MSHNYQNYNAKKTSDNPLIKYLAIAAGFGLLIASTIAAVEMYKSLNETSASKRPIQKGALEKEVLK
jgi:hypothetical protein